MPGRNSLFIFCAMLKKMNIPKPQFRLLVIFFFLAVGYNLFTGTRDWAELFVSSVVGAVTFFLLEYFLYSLYLPFVWKKWGFGWPQARKKWRQASWPQRLLNPLFWLLIITVASVLVLLLSLIGSSLS